MFCVSASTFDTTKEIVYLFCWSIKVITVLPNEYADTAKYGKTFYYCGFQNRHQTFGSGDKN